MTQMGAKEGIMTLGSGLGILVAISWFSLHRLLANRLFGAAKIITALLFLQTTLLTLCVAALISDSAASGSMKTGLIAASFGGMALIWGSSLYLHRVAR